MVKSKQEEKIKQMESKIFSMNCDNQIKNIQSQFQIRDLNKSARPNLNKR